MSYFRYNILKIKCWAYLIIFDKYILIEAHWIALYINGNDATYSDSCGVDYISNKIVKFIDNKKCNYCL